MLYNKEVNVFKKCVDKKKKLDFFTLYPLHWKPGNYLCFPVDCMCMKDQRLDAALRMTGTEKNPQTYRVHAAPS